MEIKAKRDELLATLYWTQSIVERRNTMPILGNVLIEAQKGSVRVTATDWEVGVRGSVDAEVVKEGTVTVNAKKIYEIIREVPNEQVQLKRLDNDWVEIVNRNGVIACRAVVSHRIPAGSAFMYHSQDRHVNVPVSETSGHRGGTDNSVTRIVMKPTHMIGGYAQLSAGFNYYGPTGSQRDEIVIVRRREAEVVFP